MRHGRKDYDRMQDPLPKSLGGIPEQEPVMLFRATDKFTPKVLEYYIKLLKMDQNVQQGTIKSVQAQLDETRQYQELHGAKNPDV